MLRNTTHHTASNRQWRQAFVLRHSLTSGATQTGNPSSQRNLAPNFLLTNVLPDYSYATPPISTKIAKFRKRTERSSFAALLLEALELCDRVRHQLLQHIRSNVRERKQFGLAGAACTE